MKASVIGLLSVATFALVACGSGVEQTTLTALNAKDSVAEKAVYSVAPVYRFAKLNGAYFYTGSAVEAEQIRLNYPDFRYEGVAFNQVTSGNGQFVYRFANVESGGYFYTASVAEKDYVLNNPIYKVRFRLDDAGFYVAPDADSSAAPIYRAANRANGGYLYTLSAPEVSYAVNVIGTWNDEGLKFKVPNVPTVNATWPIVSFAAYTLYSGFGTVDAFAATVDETDTFAVGNSRYKISKTAFGCTPGDPAKFNCDQQMEGNVLSICVKGAQAGSPTLYKGKHILVSAAAIPVPVTELAGKSFGGIEDCITSSDTFVFNANGTAIPPNTPLTSAADLATAFGPNGLTSNDGTEKVIARAYKVRTNGQDRYFFIEEGKPIANTANTYMILWKQK
jgi:hypothetical protein